MSQEKDVNKPTMHWKYFNMAAVSHWLIVLYFLNNSFEEGQNSHNIHSDPGHTSYGAAIIKIELHPRNKAVTHCTVCAREEVNWTPFVKGRYTRLG